MNALYWYLYGMPIALLVFMGLFAKWSLWSIENDSRKSYRRQVTAMEELTVVMLNRINGAREKEITTAFGSARAERLLAGAKESIEHAKAAIASAPKAKATWTTVARELKTAETMLNHIPMALADDDRNQLSLPEEPKPVVLD